MAADHINYEEDFNLTYKVPTYITNFSYRLVAFWFISAAVIINFGLGDMNKVFRAVEYFYPGKPSTNAEVYPRYETLYFVDRMPKIL